MDNKNEMIYVHILITKELKEELIKESEKRQLSLASYIRQVILDRKKIDE